MTEQDLKQLKKDETRQYWLTVYFIILLLVSLGLMGTFDYEEERKAHEISCQKLDSRQDSSYNKTSVEQIADECKP